MAHAPLHFDFLLPERENKKMEAEEGKLEHNAPPTHELHVPGGDTGQGKAGIPRAPREAGPPTYQIRLHRDVR